MCPKAARRNGVLLSQGDHRCPTPTHLSLGDRSLSNRLLLVDDDFVTFLQNPTQPKEDPMNLNSKLLGGAAVALLAAAFAAPAQAQTTPVYSGGGTLAEKVYRDIFNCYGNQSGADLGT